MEVTLLGTGSADGWPNAFCRCASCLQQAERGELRGPTSALVDDTLLLDCGPETPRAALRAGRRLDRLGAVLLTHAHPDHSAPMALLSRTWAHRSEPLVVAGPAEVLVEWRRWAGPDDPVVWRPLAAGDRLDVAGYTVQALPAAHDQPAVLFAVTDAAGDRLLYATDTGPLPDETVAAVAAEPLDLLLLEATFGDRTDHDTQHLDLPAFGREVARLRAAGALRPGCQVLAVHLSHHNPPAPRLDRRLAAWGARPGRDGETLTTCAGPAPAHHGLPRRTLVLGGVRSGKSLTAERLLGAAPAVTYLAPGDPVDGADPSWAERVRRHQARRPPTWRTVETTDVAGALQQAGTPVLLDCLGTWLTAVLGEAGAWDDATDWRPRAQARVDELVAAWRAVQVPVVAVSNEVGSGVVPSHTSGIVFRDWLGRRNQTVGAASERVLLVVAGRVLELP
jgi:adenosylcobinamide kinase/adenosylcobinamide-phosphate guanylyltransferase